VLFWRWKWGKDGKFVEWIFRLPWCIRQSENQRRNKKPSSEKLGLMGRESIKMVQKYAHLSPEHLQQHAAILDGFSFGKDTNWTHEPNHETRKKSLNNCLG